MTTDTQLTQRQEIIEYLEAYLNGHECASPNDLAQLIIDLKETEESK